LDIFTPEEHLRETRLPDMRSLQNFQRLLQGEGRNRQDKNITVTEDLEVGAVGSSLSFCGA